MYFHLISEWQNNLNTPKNKICKAGVEGLFHIFTFRSFEIKKFFNYHASSLIFFILKPGRKIFLHFLR
jgi:hypothetical protein